MSTHQPFEAVVTAHAGTVLRVCRAVLGVTADADDAWSETFLAALRFYPDLPEGSDVRAWLVTIAHRKAIDVTRTRRRQPVPVEHPPETVSTDGVPGSCDPDLWAAVRGLPERQRLAVAYRYLGGLPYRDVAALVGGSTDAARRAAADGVANLRTRLHDTTSTGESR